MREHDEIPAVRKLRTLVPLTAADLAEIERLLVSGNIGTERDLGHARAATGSLGLFPPDQVSALFTVLESVKASAAV